MHGLPRSDKQMVCYMKHSSVSDAPELPSMLHHEYGVSWQKRLTWYLSPQFFWKFFHLWGNRVMMPMVSVGLTCAWLRGHHFTMGVAIFLLLLCMPSLTCQTIISFSRLRVVFLDMVISYFLLFSLRWRTCFTPAIVERIVAAVVKVLIESLKRGMTNFLTKDRPPSGNARGIVLLRCDCHQNGQQSGCIFHRCFVVCHPGSRRGF